MQDAKDPSPEMLGQGYQVGDLVWAKMKGYPYWPARVESPPTNQKISTKPQHYVFFLGSRNFAWILDDFIIPHSEKMLQSCSKKKSATYQKAIEALLELANNKAMKKSNASVEDKVTPKKSLVASNTEKKIHKIKRPPKGFFPKRVRPLKIQKKIVRKLQPSEGRRDNNEVLPPSSEQNVDSDHSTHPTPVLCSGEYSRIAVIRPFDDANINQTSHILQRTEYIERPKTPELDINKISETLLRKNVKATKKKIGFLGLGMMGRGIVKNLLNSGHDVTIWNRSPERYTVFKTSTAKVAQTPADVIANSDITFCCVSDPEAVKALVFGNCGVLKGFDGVNFGTKGYVEMTSIDPTTSRDIAEAITYVGGKYVEAPLSGSRTLAEEGSLLILAAGDRDLFNDCETCFCAAANHAYYLGDDVGHASKMSLVLSMLHGTTFGILAEAVALLERCGLPLNVLLEFFNYAPMTSTLLREKLQAMIDRNFTLNTALKHQQKDLSLGLLLGNSVEQPMLVAAAANEVFKHAKFLRYADHDVSAVLYGAKY